MSPAPEINRRDVLHLAVAGGTASALLPATSGVVETDVPTIRIVDTNVSLFHWPFRRLPLENTATLVAKLRSLGIAQAWAGSYEGLLHRDIAAVNKRLTAACADYAELVPIGSINVTLPNWQDDLKRCVDDHSMPGIRLHPNYHGYTLSDPRFRELLQLATDAGIFVQLAVAMEDNRTQHALVRVADVDLTPLERLAQSASGLRIQILNARLQTTHIEQPGNLAGVFFDTARVDGTDGIPTLVGRVPSGRVLFGSHAPFLIPEAALIRVHESGQLPDEALRAVLSNNAEQLLRGKKP